MRILLQPQEVEVFYILPAIRKAFATALKANGKTQKEVATLLGVTEGAVSQYFSNKRADVQFPDELITAVKKAAPSIKDTESMIKATQAIIQLAKEQRFLCKLHEKVAGTIPKGCDICFKGE